MFGPATPWVVIGCTLLTAVLASLYLALHTVTRAAVDEVAARRARRQPARRIERILDDTAAHAQAVGLLKVVAMAGVAVGWVEWATRMRLGPGAAPSLLDAALGLTGAAGTLFVFAVALPMSIAGYAGARLVYARSGLVRIIRSGAGPLVSAGKFLDEMVRRLTGVEVKDAADQVQEELRQVVEEGEQAGAIDEQEREMIEAVMHFGELTVQQIMTPRTDVEALEATNNLGAVTQAIRRIGHSRIPVYEGSLDQVVGIFYVKDLMRWLAGDGAHGGGKPFDLKAILRPAVFVPETKTVRELLREMIDKKVHIALVADEYGGTSGLVTIEDIVEEIVGDIKDEYEPGPSETPDVVLRAEQKQADIDAGARISDVNDHLSTLGVEIPVSDEYDTVGGFVITTLGRIPATGERFVHERMSFRILEAKPTRVVRVGLEVLPEPSLTAGDHQPEPAEPSAQGQGADR